MGRSDMKTCNEMAGRKAPKKRTIYVDIGVVVEDDEDCYIEVEVPRKGLVYDIMLQLQGQSNIDFEDGYYLEEHGDRLKGKWHLEEIDGDTQSLKQK